MAKYSLPQPIPLPNPYSLFRGFNFIRPIRIENSGAALRDYQVKITLTQDNFPFEKCKPDGADIRFRADSGETVSYWIESWSNNQAIIWCKIPYIPEESSTFLWMVYGNPTAKSQSNISQTFIREINGAQSLKCGWHFDEGTGSIAYDSSGNDNDGSLGNSPLWVNGKFGAALRFDGGSTYIEKANPSFLPMSASQPRSYVMWIKIFSTELYGRLVSFDSDFDSGAGMEFAINGENNQLAFFDGAWHDAGSSGVIGMDTWYHVALTFDGSTAKIYKNNSAVLSVSSDGIENKSKITVGNRAGYYNEGINGDIDEFFLFNKELSSEEMSDLYNYYGYSTTNYPGRVLIRKYAYPEPTIIL